MSSFFFHPSLCLLWVYLSVTDLYVLPNHFFSPPQLKFFLSMYGHKLPVMAMDISSDDALLVTASSDKNVKIWVKNNYIL